MRKSTKSALIFLICYVAYTGIYVARLNLSMASPSLVELGIADAAQIGILGSVFSVIYACGRLINGGLGDRLPPWVMICTGLAIAGFSNLVIGILPPFWAIVVLWGANAYAQSMLWSSVLCTVSTVYDGEKAKKMASYMVTSVATGNIFGIVLNTWVVNKFGVNFAFVIPGAIILILGIFVFFAIKNVKPQRECQKKHIPIFELLKNEEILKLVPPVLFHGAIKDNISLWMTVYFVDVFLIDLGSSASFVLFIPIVGFIGRMLYPLIYKFCRAREHVVSVISFFLCALITLPLCFNIKSAFIAVICLSLIYALVSVINTSMLTIYPIRYSETGNVSSVSGLMDFITYLGSGLSSWIYGIIIKNYGYSPMYISWVVITAISVVIIYRVATNTNLKRV